MSRYVVTMSGGGFPCLPVVTAADLCRQTKAVPLVPFDPTFSGFAAVELIDLQLLTDVWKITVVREVLTSAQNLRRRFDLGLALNKLLDNAG